MKFRTSAWVQLTAVLVASATFSVASEVSQRLVTVAYDKTPFIDALKDLQDKSGLKLAFSNAWIADAGSVTFQWKNVPAEKVLLELLRPWVLKWC